MPRQARKKSCSNIYHLMMRGINRQVIFEDNDDYKRFLDTLIRFKGKCDYTIYAYCLMSNHVHLLLKVGQEPLEKVMRRICASYVRWYNYKYERIGYLFQDRFKSEVVENEDTVSRVENILELQKLDKVTRDKYLKELRERHGFSIRQIERLTGINRGVIQRV